LPRLQHQVHWAAARGYAPDGEKEKARQAMKKAKVPILPGSDGVIATVEEAGEWAKRVASR